jgi:predicted deacylase
MSRNKPVTIAGVTVEPGSRKTVEIPVADLYTASSVSMPVQVINGRSAGPRLFVCAAIHGDELNGVEIIRRLLKRKALQSIRGTLLAVPVVNVHGFLNQSRYLPDRRDLNRSFPGSAKGSIASRLAHQFLNEVVFKADLGIDLHTGAIDRSNLPQVRANLDTPGTEELATAFGAPVIVNAKLREGSLRACASERDIPILVYESGEALRFDELCIRAGIRGVINVMANIGMIRSTARSTRRAPVVARSTRWVRSPISGMVSARAALGSTVTRDKPLALVSDPFGEIEEQVLAPFDGIVIGRSNLPLVHEGDALFNVAAFSSVDQAENVVEEFSAVHDPAMGRQVESEFQGT